MEIKVDIEAVIHAHSVWKTRFRDFLGGKAGLDLSDVAHTNACELGMWLDTGGRRWLAPEDHEEICKQHDLFHQTAGEIVHHIKQKDFEAARQMIASGGSFNQVSQDLVTLLRKAELHGSRQGSAGEMLAVASTSDRDSSSK